MNYKRRRILQTLIVMTFMMVFGYSTVVYAHPHMFFTTQASYVFDDQGLAAIRVEWEMDEYTSILVLDSYDVDKDGVLNDDELFKLQNEEFARIQEDESYLHIKVDGKYVDIPAITDFVVSAPENQSITYNFTIPLVIKTTSEVALAQYDETYFTDFVPADAQPVSIQGGDVFDAKLFIRTDDAVTFYFDQFNPIETSVSFVVVHQPANTAEMTDTTAESNEASEVTLPSADQPMVESEQSEPEIEEEITAKVEVPIDNLEESQQDTAATSTSVEITTEKAEESETDIEAILPEVEAPKEIPKESATDIETTLPEVETPIEESKKSLFDQINIVQEAIQSHIMTILNEESIEGASQPIILLSLLAFGYGAAHVAGPGHGKGLTVSYVIADGRQLKKALLMGILIPVLHSISGVLVVFGMSQLLQASVLSAMDNVTRPTQLASYGLMILLGIWITFKSILEWRNGTEKEKTMGNGRFGALGTAVIVGIVPCPGVVFLLLFGKALGVLELGIMMAFAMMLGMVVGLTGLTLIAYGSRRWATKHLEGNKAWSARIENALELLGGLMIITYSSLFFFSAFR